MPIPGGQHESVFPARPSTRWIFHFLQKRLNKYALAASAAGVGVLALTHSAEAKIIYTPTHRVINAGQHYNLDLNHDGKTDFSIQNYSNTFEGSQQGFLFR